MTDGKWPQIKQRFQQLVDTSPDCRERRLRQLESDEDIINEVLLLFRHEPGAPTFDGPLSVTTENPRYRSGTRFGPYTVDDLIGSGGMGEVYSARRTDGHYDQLVAIKVLRAGHVSLNARALDEQQLLARLSHPNIARIMDAGTGDHGETYFAMELIQGLPLLEYCQSRSLTLGPRLALFQTVCEAVEHAHRALVLHRDLKPDNILVTHEGQPRLLDFGIARLLDEVSGTAPAGPATQRGIFALTPEYASPEQLRGEPLTVATDVYALGVVLYQLLTGELPYSFVRRSPDQMIKVVTEATVAPPSLRVRDGPITSRELRGDLDRIVAVAMHRDVQRRYATVAELAKDVANFRQGKPIAARPDSATYRLNKFLRRNLLASISVGLVVALIAISSAVIWRQEQARIQQATKAAALSQFMLGLFDSVTPTARGSSDFTVSQLLAAGMVRAEQELIHEPETMHQALQKIAQTYLLLGEHEELRRVNERIQAQVHLLPEASLYRSDAQQLNAVVLSQPGHAAHDAEAALSSMQNVLTNLSRQPTGDRQRLTAVRLNLGELLYTMGKPDEAEVHLQAALKLAGIDPAVDPRRIKRLLANVHRSRGELEQSLSLTLEAISESEQWENASPSRSQALLQRTASRTLARMGQYEEAVIQAQDAASSIARLYGQQHLLHADFLLHLAVIYDSVPNPAEMFNVAQQASEILRRSAPDSSAYFRALKTMGEAKRQLGAHDLAIDLTRRALKGFKRHDQWLTITTYYQLAKTENEIGDHQQALASLDAAAALLAENGEQSIGPSQAQNFSLLLGAKRVETLVALGSPSDAYEEVLRLRAIHDRYDPTDRLQTINRFRLALWSGVALERLGRLEAAKNENIAVKEFLEFLPDSLIREDLASAEKLRLTR